MPQENWWAEEKWSTPTQFIHLLPSSLLRSSEEQLFLCQPSHYDVQFTIKILVLYSFSFQQSSTQVDSERAESAFDIGAVPYHPSVKSTGKGGASILLGQNWCAQHLAAKFQCTTSVEIQPREYLSEFSLETGSRRALYIKQRTYLNFLPQFAFGRISLLVPKDTVGTGDECNVGRTIRNTPKNMPARKLYTHADIH